MFGAGQTIGNYRVLSKIGTGGMGAVYLAEHPLIGKRVALKVIHRELAGNRDVVQRFQQEARAVNTIGNEHIVEIHDFGTTLEGDHFFIMEYLDGKTLASVLAKDAPGKQLDVMRSLHIGAQIASALGAAHHHGIIHRDLKPDNIMLMTRLGDPDFVKVLDFGLAKVLMEASAVKTAAGVLLGTPQYMSPEACESKQQLDARTDIYALGILLFQMLAGVLPFDGETMGEVLVKQVTALPPAPRAFNPMIPPSVEQIVLRCLAKPVESRFQSMFELRDALRDPEAYLRGSPPIAPARSVAPLMDARTMMLAPPAAQQTRITDISQAPSQQKTHIAMNLPPMPVAPGQGKTIVAGTAPHVAAQQQTMIAGGPLAPLPARMPTGAVMVPGLAAPQQPFNHTMRIATPLGHSSRPARRMWPIVVVLGLLLGLGGGAFAVAWFGRGEGGAAGSEPVAAAGDAGAEAVASDAGAAKPAVAVDAAPAKPIDAPPPVDAAPPRAKLTIESVPKGAQVTGPDGAVLGKTPLVLDWPVSDAPVTFELKASGYKKRPKELVVTGNTMIRVELERSARPTQRPDDGPAEPPGGGLMRPE